MRKKMRNTSILGDQSVEAMIFWASRSITSAPKALLLRPILAAAVSTIRFSACDKYTTNLNGFFDFGRRREIDRRAFIQETGRLLLRSIIES